MTDRTHEFHDLVHASETQAPAAVSPFARTDTPPSDVSALFAASVAQTTHTLDRTAAAVARFSERLLMLLLFFPFVFFHTSPRWTRTQLQRRHHCLRSAARAPRHSGSLARSNRVWSRSQDASMRSRPAAAHPARACTPTPRPSTNTALLSLHTSASALPPFLTTIALPSRLAQPFALFDPHTLPLLSLHPHKTPTNRTSTSNSDADRLLH